LVKALEWQINEFKKGKTPDYDIIRGVMNYFLSFPDLYHHPKEDLVYELLDQRDHAAAESIGDLRRQHEELAARSRELSVGINAVLEEAQVPRESLVRWARDFIELQVTHMQMEEEVFFPLALKTLTDDDWRSLEARMTDQEDPLFGEGVGGNFDTLREKILAWQADWLRDHA